MSPSSLHKIGLPQQPRKPLNPPAGSLDWTELITASFIHSHTLREHLVYAWVWARGEMKHQQGAHGLVVRAVMAMWCRVEAVLPPKAPWICALMLHVPRPENLWILKSWDTWALPCLCQ